MPLDLDAFDIAIISPQDIRQFLQTFFTLLIQGPLAFLKEKGFFENNVNVEPVREDCVASISSDRSKALKFRFQTLNCRWLNQTSPFGRRSWSRRCRPRS